MVREIKDRFTKLKLQGKPPQRLYVLRQMALGLCRTGDGRKIYKCGMCRKHWNRNLELRRAKYKKPKYPPDKPEPIPIP